MLRAVKEFWTSEIKVELNGQAPSLVFRHGYMKVAETKTPFLYFQNINSNLYDRYRINLILHKIIQLVYSIHIGTYL